MREARAHKKPDTFTLCIGVACMCKSHQIGRAFFKVAADHRNQDIIAGLEIVLHIAQPHSCAIRDLAQGQACIPRLDQKLGKTDLVPGSNAMARPHTGIRPMQPIFLQLAKVPHDFGALWARSLMNEVSGKNGACNSRQ